MKRIHRRVASSRAREVLAGVVLFAMASSVGGQQSGAIKLDATAYTATEGFEPVVVTASRVGGVSGRASALFALTVGTASSSDYAIDDPAGAVDPVFDPHLDMSGSVAAVAPLADGRLMIGGSFVLPGDTTPDYLARLSADGSLDNTFNPVDSANDSISSMAVQSDERLLIGGAFTAYGATSHPYLARLSANGDLDDFNAGMSGPDGVVRGIVVQSDGRIVIVGDFTHYNGMAAPYIARLFSDGSRDMSLDPSLANPDAPVNGIAQDSSGRLLIGGSFTTIGGEPRSMFARLLADGTPDSSFFHPTFGFDGTVNALAVQTDGRIIVGGSFSSFSFNYHPYLLRLTRDGVFDSSFTLSGNGPNQRVLGVAVQPDDQIVIAGDFTAYGGASREHLARLFGQGGFVANWSDGDGGTRSFVIRATDDGVQEPTESATLALASVNGAIAGTPSSATLTIMDKPPPTISAVSPNTGSVIGGETVTITGTHFDGTTGVSVGGGNTRFTVISPTSLSITTPRGDVGTVDIVVFTTGGGSATSIADHYTYIIPADLSATVSNGVDFVDGGGTVQYLIDVANTGALPVYGATLTDMLPATLSNVLWTCANLTGNGGCPPGKGQGALDATISLIPGNSLRFTLTGTVATVPETPLVYAVSINGPGGVVDVHTENNASQDGPDVIGVFRNGFD